MNMSLFVKGIEILPYDELLSSLHKSGSSVTLMKHMHACALSSLSACGLLVIMSTTTHLKKKKQTHPLTSPISSLSHSDGACFQPELKQTSARLVPHLNEGHQAAEASRTSESTPRSNTLPLA